jgi:hypothetical protein
MTMACKHVLVAFSLQFLFWLAHACENFQSSLILIIQLLILCPCMSSCFLIHILNFVFEPSSFYGHSFALGYLRDL